MNKNTGIAIIVLFALIILWLRSIFSKTFIGKTYLTIIDFFSIIKFLGFILLLIGLLFIVKKYRSKKDKK